MTPPARSPTTCSTAGVQLPGRPHRPRHRAGRLPHHANAPTASSATIPTCPKYESDGKTLSPLAGPGGHRQPVPRAVRDRGHPGGRPHRARRGVAADQHARRHQAARGVHQAQRAGLLPGVRPGRLPRLHRLRQSGDHQRPQGRLLRARRSNNLGPCNAHPQRARHEHAHEPHARPAHLQQRRPTTHYSLHPVLRLASAWPDAERLRARRSATPNGNGHLHGHAGRHLQAHRLRPVERHPARRPGGHRCRCAERQPPRQTQRVPGLQWRANLYTRTFLDQNGDGVSQDAEPGLPLVNTNIRYRDGSFGFFNNTDLNGFAGLNEIFPFMDWLVVETDTTRYKPTAVHAVYDAGGPVDCSSQAAAAAAAPHRRQPRQHRRARVPLPADLRRPGRQVLRQRRLPGRRRRRPAPPPAPSSRRRPSATPGLAGPARPEQLHRVRREALRAGENGGINGHVIYASTRPFDDPALLLQLSWEPGVPHVQGQPVPGRRSTPDGNEQPEARRHHHDQQLGRLGAGLPQDATATSSGAGRRLRPEHELPGPGPDQPVLPDPEGQQAVARPEQPQAAARLPLAVQVLRRLVDAEPDPAGAVRRHVQVPERDRHRPGDRGATATWRPPSPGAAAQPVVATRTDLRPDPRRQRRCCRPASTWSRSSSRPATSW